MEDLYLGVGDGGPLSRNQDGGPLSRSQGWRTFISESGMEDLNLGVGDGGPLSRSRGWGTFISELTPPHLHLCGSPSPFLVVNASRQKVPDQA